MADPQHPRLRDTLMPPLLLMRCQICGVTLMAYADEAPAVAVDGAIGAFKAHLDSAHDGWCDGAYSSWGDA